MYSIYVLICFHLGMLSLPDTVLRYSSKQIIAQFHPAEKLSLKTRADRRYFPSFSSLPHQFKVTSQTTSGHK